MSLSVRSIDFGTAAANALISYMMCNYILPLQVRIHLKSTVKRWKILHWSKSTEPALEHRLSKSVTSPGMAFNHIIAVCTFLHKWLICNIHDYYESMPSCCVQTDYRTSSLTKISWTPRVVNVPTSYCGQRPQARQTIYLNLQHTFSTPHTNWIVQPYPAHLGGEHLIFHPHSHSRDMYKNHSSNMYILELQWHHSQVIMSIGLAYHRPASTR